MPAPFMRAVLLICHLFIQLLWGLTSRGRNQESLRKTWKNIRSVPIVLFEVIGILQVLFFPFLAFPISQHETAHVKILGVVIAVLGTALASWAKIVMGPNWGRPAQHDKKTQSRLVTTGPFSYTRNPIYVGLIMLYLGQQIALQSYGIFLTVLFVIVVKQAVVIEEKLLTSHFGRVYVSYMKRTPRFL